MSKKPQPTPRFTVITLGVGDMRASVAVYEALGFVRKMRATGEAAHKTDYGGYSGGKSWSRPASKSATTVGFTCRIEAAAWRRWRAE